MVAGTLPEEKKKAASQGSLKDYDGVLLHLFIHMGFVTVHELVNPSCRVYKLHLSGIERM